MLAWRLPRRRRTIVSSVHKVRSERRQMTYVSGIGGHDGEVVVMDDLLHVLNTS